MSRFKRIKNTSTKKSSVSINEKIAALNQELEKTGMSNVSEMMTTNNVLSSSEYVPPQERIISDVPNSSGIGGDGFTQSSAGSGTEGDAPNHSSLSDLYNTDVGHPIYKSTSYNGQQGYGIVIGPSFGAGTTYGIIEGGNIYRAIFAKKNINFYITNSLGKDFDFQDDKNDNMKRELEKRDKLVQKLYKLLKDGDNKYGWGNTY